MGSAIGKKKCIVQSIRLLQIIKSHLMIELEPSVSIERDVLSDSFSVYD